MGYVTGISSTRVSDTFIRQRVTSQMLSDQLEMLRIQTQLGTGRRIQLPSEDPDAALRIIGLQRLLEQKDQLRVNLSTNQSYMTATDTALSTVGSSLAEARAVALGAVGTTVSDAEREAAALQIRDTIQHLLDVGNQKFRGRYLFAGTGTTVRPFQTTGAGLVQYLGDEGRLSSYSDLDVLFDTNLHGSEVFGAISQPVRGTADLDPILTFDTRLADLRGGLGLTLGTIKISNGSTTSTVDLGSAETLGDVAALIRADSGTLALDVEITHTGLKIVGAPGDLLTIRDVGTGTTAQQLGILATTPTNTIVGDDLDPVLRLTTRLDDVLGRRACAVIRSSGADNDVIFESATVGAASDGIKIVFDDDGSVVIPGMDEAASYDPATRTLTVTVKTGQTKARHVVAAVEAAYALGNVPLTARLDPLDEQAEGRGIVDLTPPGGTPLSGGSGATFDRTSGLRIVNAGSTHTLSFGSAVTVGDMLRTLNTSGAGLLAEINADATGIDLRSRTNGADFMVGENGGTTATQLGLRTFTAQARLEDLNFGRGVIDQEGTAAEASADKIWPGENNDLVFRARNAGPAWNGFTISFLEGVPPGTESFTYDPVAKTMVFEIFSGSTTANDVIALLATDPQAAADFAVTLDSGDGSPNDGTGLVAIGGAVTTAGGATAGTDFTITLADGTEFEIDLSANDGSGLVAATDAVAPPGAAGGSATSYASVAVASAGLDNNLIFQAKNLGAAYNGTKINFQANPGAPAAVVAYTAGVEMTFDFDPGVTTAQDIITALGAHVGASADFSAALDQTDGSLAQNVADVLNQINAKDPTRLQARLATYGNGIELVDLSSGTGALTVTKSYLSRAAVGLGLLVEGQSSQSSTTAATPAAATLTSAGANNDLIFTAVQSGPGMNGVQVNFNSVPGGPIAFSFAAATLTVDFDPGVSTAQDIINALAGDPLATTFAAALDPTDGNDGSGFVAAGSAAMSGGSQTLTGSDVNPLETDGIFTALVRLHAALKADDVLEIARAIGLLDERMVEMNFSRAELGARQQGLDSVQVRMEAENVDLQATLSEDLDADIVEVISNLSARQLAFEASMRSAASIFQMTLLDYL